MSKPIIVDYATAQLHQTAIEIRQDEESLVIVVPPPRRWRSVFHAAFSGTCLSLGLATVLILFAIAGAEKLVVTVTLVVIFVAFLVGGLLTFVKLIQIVSRGSLPALILVSDGALEVRSPSAFILRSRKWPRAGLEEVSIREVGVLRALVRYLEIQVILSEERVEHLRVPWSGEGSLALAENRLREALRLPPPAALTA